MANKVTTIGERLSPILESMEQVLWEHESEDGSKPEFTQEGFRAGVKIFMSVMMDRMYSLQRNEDMGLEEMSDMAETLGKEVRQLVKTYCDIDTHELYK
jgi:hypothetical protein